MNKESLSKKLFFGIFYLLSSSVVTLGIKVVTIAFVARKLGVENFGLYSALIAFIGLFQFLSDFGLNKTLLKFGSRDLNNARISFGNALLVKSILIIPLLAIVAACGYFSGYKSENFFSLMLFAMSMVFDSYANVFSSIRRILGNFKLISFFRIVKTIITLAVYVIVLTKYNSVFALAVATISLTLFMFIVALINTVLLLKPKLKLNLLAEFFNDSIIFSFNDFFLNIYARIGIVILSFYNEFFVVGIYSAAIRFTKIASLLPRQIRFALLPTVYRLLDEKTTDNRQQTTDLDDGVLDISEEQSEGEKLIKANKSKSKRVFNLLLKYMVITAAPIAVIVCYFSDEIIHLIFGSKYNSSILFVQILTIFIFLRFIETPFTLFFLGLNKHKNLVSMQGIASLLNVSLCLILIPKFSAYGAAFATNISELVFALMILISGIAYKIWDAWGTILKIVNPLVLCLIALMAVVNFSDGFNPLIQIFLVSITYFVLLVIARQFGKEDKKFFKKVFLKAK